MSIGNADRRDFMRIAAIGSAGALAACWNGALLAGAFEPDMILVNARVHTVDEKAPVAQGFAVRDNRFVAVGSNEQMRALVGKRTRVIDAKGAVVVPGFIDCHNHAPGEILLYDVLVGNPFDVEFVTIESIIDKLRARAAKTPPGYWVQGYFFDDTKVKDERRVTCQDLDRVSTDHPVAVHHRGGHSCYFNSKAFALAGITSDSANPFGGTFDRSPDGRLNGRVTDLALNVFANVGGHERFTAAQNAKRSHDAMAFMSNQFVRAGLTTVHHEGGDLAAMQQVRTEGVLRHRISYEAIGSDFGEDVAGSRPVLDDFIADGIRSGFGDPWIRVGATYERTVDGSFSERTMAISQPYTGITPPYMGNVTETQDSLNSWTEAVHRVGFQVNCHANGDVAIGMVLTAYERMLKLHPVANARPKITHCTLVNDDLIRRIKAIDAVPALFSTYSFYNSDKFKFYGGEMMKHCMAFRSMLDAGIHVAAGSDFDPGPFSPLMAIQAMVTRTGWDGTTWGGSQRINVSEALKVNTLNGAYNSGEEQLKGSISVGKLADYVMLAEDPHSIAPNKIKDIQILCTVTGGDIQYQV